MNYIRHLNAFFSFIGSDKRLSASHISLYMALFQYWNFNRFQNPFPIYRDNIMKLSKIGSKNTYHKCIKELHEAKYIYYHPPVSKFQPGRVSLARFDVQEEPVSRYKQLELFNTSENENQNSKTIIPTKPSLPLPGGDLEGGSGTDFDTDSVPILTVTSTDFDTVPVPKMGHNIKHKHFNKTESKPPSQKIFDKNEKLSEAINSLAGVPNSVHDTKQTRGAINPTLNEIEEFFKSANYPDTEAKKFFNYYKSIGWKIKGITPIEDWKAAAHKWMINAGKFEGKTQHDTPAPKNDIEGLYKQFLTGQNIFKQITSGHFTELKLELTDEIMQHAWKERINQLTGSNQNSILQLLQAYQENKENDPLLLKDQDNLSSLAKRIRVLKHFQQQKSKQP